MELGKSCGGRGGGACPVCHGQEVLSRVFHQCRSADGHITGVESGGDDFTSVCLPISASADLNFVLPVCLCANKESVGGGTVKLECSQFEGNCSCIISVF